MRMKMNMKRRVKQIIGFTLLEMLLVLVIVSMIVVMGTNYLQQRTLEMRIDRATTQVQQILNAALAYYVVNGFWPTDLAALQNNSSYLPTSAAGAGTMMSPWNTTYTVTSSSTAPSSLIYVYFPVTYASSSGQASAVAHIIAGRLPLSFVTATAPAVGAVPQDDGTCNIGDTTATCYVVAAVNVPGQNLNNATAVNYAGIYHSGSCVPAPTCPVDKNGLPMKAEIMVVPVSVSGVYGASTDAPTTAGGAHGTCGPTNLAACQINVYPLSSFTARAVGDSTGAPVLLSGGKGPASCDGTISSDKCLADYTGTTLTTAGSYWRVCLSTVTEKGTTTIPPSNPMANPWGQLQGSVMAITRCAPSNENTGSGFTVWSQ